MCPELGLIRRWRRGSQAGGGVRGRRTCRAIGSNVACILHWYIGDDDMLTPTGYSPHTQQPIWPTAHTAHSQPALRPHRTTPRAEDKPPQTHRPHSNLVPMMMICLPPQGTPPPHSSRYGPQHTQHTASTAATPHYPQGRRQTLADAPTPLKRSMLTPFGGPRPMFGAKARERWFTRSNGSD